MKRVATAKRPIAKISLRDSVEILKKIRSKPVNKAKTFLTDLVEQKRSLDGKYYTKASGEILKLIEESEKNAESQGLDRERLFIKEAFANKSFRFILPKSRWSHRGKRAKICQLMITLGEG